VGLRAAGLSEQGGLYTLNRLKTTFLYGALTGLLLLIGGMLGRSEE
jgi:hypothetical protein